MKTVRRIRRSENGQDRLQETSGFLCNEKMAKVAPLQRKHGKAKYWLFPVADPFYNETAMGLNAQVLTPAAECDILAAKKDS